VHAHVEIVALRIGRRNVLLVGFARDGRLDRASSFGGAVAGLRDYGDRITVGLRCPHWSGPRS
jgi:hypothetical protein